MQQQRLPFESADSNPKNELPPPRPKPPVAKPVSDKTATPKSKSKSPSRTSSFHSSRTRRIRANDAQTPSLFPELDTTPPVNKPDQTSSHRPSHAVQQRLPFDASAAPVDESSVAEEALVEEVAVSEEPAAVESTPVEAASPSPGLNFRPPEKVEEDEDASDPFAAAVPAETAPSVSDTPEEVAPTVETPPPPVFKLAAPIESPDQGADAAPKLKLSATPVEMPADASPEEPAASSLDNEEPLKLSAAAFSPSEEPDADESADQPLPFESTIPSGVKNVESAEAPKLKLSAPPPQESAGVQPEESASVEASREPEDTDRNVHAPVSVADQTDPLEGETPVILACEISATPSSLGEESAEAPKLKLSAAPPQGSAGFQPAENASAEASSEPDDTDRNVHAPVTTEPLAAEAPKLKLSAAPEKREDQATLKLSVSEPEKDAQPDAPATPEAQPEALKPPLAAPPRATRPAVAVAKPKPKSASPRPVPQKRNPAETDDDLPSDAATESADSVADSSLAASPEPVLKSASETGFGERLRIARESHGHTRQETAQACRIRPDFVRALEEEDFHKLPRAAIHIKSYVRTLAREYDLDPIDLLEACEVAMAAADLSIHPEPVLRDSTKVRQAQMSSGEDDAQPSGVKPAAFVLAGLVAVIGVILIAYVLMTRGGAAPTPEMAPVDSVTEADVEMLLAPEMLPFWEVPLPAAEAEPLSPPPPAPAP